MDNVVGAQRVARKNGTAILLIKLSDTHVVRLVL